MRPAVRINLYSMVTPLDIERILSLVDLDTIATDRRTT